jgi:hypothetical protein
VRVKYVLTLQFTVALITHCHYGVRPLNLRLTTRLRECTKFL